MSIAEPRARPDTATQTSKTLADRRGRSAAIAGLGYYLPDDTITNSDLAKMVQTSDEWIASRTGIRCRRRADDAEATSDLATIAGRRALADAGIVPEQLDFILVATVTPDMPVPAASCVVQNMLGANNAAAMDVNAGCSGFLYGLHVANSLVRSGAARHVLVIGAEILTRVTDYSDRRTCVLFGDGAGACVVSATGALRVIYSAVRADGSQKDLIQIPAGGSRTPTSADTVSDNQHYLRLDGQKVFKHAVRRMVQAGLEALDAVNLSPDSISWVIPHQANERIISAVAEQLGVPVPKVVMDLADIGNTSSASVPIALTRARDATAFRPGELGMLLAFGAGLTWSCQLLRVEDVTGNDGQRTVSSAPQRPPPATL